MKSRSCFRSLLRCVRRRASRISASSRSVCAGQKCLELKSLKMYTLEYRNLGIFYENVINRFLRDVVNACEPIRATLVGDFTPRGGIQSKITASWSRDRGYGV